MGLLSWIGGNNKSQGQQILGGAGLDLIGGLADSALGAYYDRKAASRSNKYALFARSTAHQVEVEDLKKAGLNPVLSALGTGSHGASYNAPSAVRNANPAPVFSNAAKALTRAEVRRAQAEAESAEAKAKVDSAEADVRKDSLNEALKAQQIDNTYRGDNHRYKLRKLDAEASRLYYALDALDPLERRKLKATLQMMAQQRLNEERVGDKLTYDNALREAENAFWLGNPFLHGFHLMGGSAQQLGKLSDYTDQILDLFQFLKNPRAFEQIRKFGKGWEQTIRRSIK